MPTWFRGPRIAIGDAGHAPSPTSGQGASRAIEDGVVLAKFCATSGMFLVRSQLSNVSGAHAWNASSPTERGEAKDHGHRWANNHDYDPLRRGSRHRRSGNNLFRLAEQGVSQILGRRVLCERRHSVLSLSRRCFGPALGHELCADATTQRGTFHHSPHSLPDMLLLWLYQKAKGFDQPQR
jgi:hypothetical protein